MLAFTAHHSPIGRYVAIAQLQQLNNDWSTTIIDDQRSLGDSQNQLSDAQDTLQGAQQKMTDLQPV